MSDLSWRHPGVRRRRSRWRRASELLRGPAPLRLAATLVLVGAVLAAAYAWRERRPAPRRAFVDGMAALGAGRLEDARASMVAAAPFMPGEAQIVLARIAVERGDATAAAIALERARAAGIEPRRLLVLAAAARLLDGDTDAARAAAAAAGSGYRSYADRIVARADAQDGMRGAALARLDALVARRPRNGGAWRDLAAIRLDGGDVAGAALAASRSLALDGRAPATLWLEGRIVRLRYGAVASLAWFDAALARDPRFVPALLDRAATRGDAGRATAAVADARAAIALRPDQPQGWFCLAVLAARGGELQVARRLLAHVDAQAMPGATLLTGWLDRADGHDDLAIAAWQGLLTAQPRNAVVRRLLAAALLRSGDAAGALAAASPITDRGDADAYTLEIAARAARGVGRAGLAAALHDRAIGDRRRPADAFGEDDDVGALAAQAAASGDPGDAVALIRGLLGRGDAADAVTRADALAGGSGNVAAARLVQGDVRAATGHDADAVTAYVAAANLQFDEPTALRLVDALIRTGRGVAAAQALTLYLAQNPQSLAANRIAGRWQTLGGVTAMATLARVSRAIGLSEAATTADLARARLQAGDRHRALALARYAYRLAPMRRDVVATYAAVLEAAGRQDGARQLRSKLAILADAAAALG